jgi:acetyltransferase-like isoleucine patch superfamily enzyme
VIARPIVIERNVWIAAGAIIIGGVTVGENAVVAAGSVVTKDVPPNTLVAGNPARVIRSIAE